MKERLTRRPILFSTPMVQALDRGVKRQTRRVVKHQPTGKPMPRSEWGAEQRHLGRPPASAWMWPFYPGPGEHSAKGWHCPYGRVGDTLWVRETWDFRPWGKGVVRVSYAAGGEQKNFKKPELWNPMLYNYQRWRPSIHMPAWACRTTLKITKVRLQRLHRITEADAKAEGATRLNPKESYRVAFRRLWDKINGGRKGCAWADNPWVWAVTFKKKK